MIEGFTFKELLSSAYEIDKLDIMLLDRFGTVKLRKISSESLGSVGIQLSDGRMLTIGINDKGGYIHYGALTVRHHLNDLDPDSVVASHLLEKPWF